MKNNIRLFSLYPKLPNMLAKKILLNERTKKNQNQGKREVRSKYQKSHSESQFHKHFNFVVFAQIPPKTFISTI